MAKILIKSYPWPTIIDEDTGLGDRDYTDADFADYFKTIFGTGVILSALNGFEASAVAGQKKVKIDTGLAYLEGRMALNETAVEPDFLAPTSGTRYDYVILESDADERKINIYVKEGTSGAPPAVTRAGDIFEAALFKLTLTSTMTDLTSAGCAIESMIANDTVCGIINRLNQNKVDSLFDDTLPQLNGTWAGFAQNAGNGGSYKICVDADDNIFVIGGDTSPYNFTNKFDTTWHNLTAMTTGRSYIGLSEYGGYIYAIGGTADAWTGVSKKNERLSITGNTWAGMTDKTTGTACHAQVYLNGKIYCFGGLTAYNTWVKTSEAYNIADNDWDNLADLPTTPTLTATYRILGATDGTDIFLYYLDASDGAGTKKFIKYNTGSNTYTTLAAPPTASIYEIFFADGCIFAFYNNTIYKYTIATDEWITLTTASGLAVTSYGALAMLSDRRIMMPIYGGSNSKSFTYYYYIGTTTQNQTISIRKRSDANLKIMNLTAQAFGDGSMGFLLGDKYGIIVNLSTVTATSHDLELVG